MGRIVAAAAIIAFAVSVAAQSSVATLTLTTKPTPLGLGQNLFEVSVKDAKAMGWTMTRIYSRDNSMPVHRACAPRLVRTGIRVPPVQDDQDTHSATGTAAETMIESRW